MPNQLPASLSTLARRASSIYEGKDTKLAVASTVSQCINSVTHSLMSAIGIDQIGFSSSSPLFSTPSVAIDFSSENETRGVLL